MSKTQDQNRIKGQSASTAPRATQAATAQQVITGPAASTAPMATQAVLGRLDISLPEDHPAYASIGRVSAEWAHLEHVLDDIFWEMAGVRPEIGSCITGQLMGHSPRFHVIKALGTFHGLHKKLFGEIEDIANRTSGLAKDRARIVHDAWYFEPTTGSLSQFRSILPQKDTFGLETISNESVQDLIDKIIERRESIARIRQKIKDALASSK